MTCCTEKVMTIIRSFLPCRYKNVKYKELYLNMGHLGAETAL